METEVTKKVALFGGSFNPPTVGHAAVIEACLTDETFDEVWVMPSKDRSDKQMGTVTPHQRLSMLEIVRHEMFDDSARLVISDFELLLSDGLTETTHTMNALNNKFPEISFWNIYGIDSYTSMPSWQGGQELQDHLNICVVNRHGSRLSDGLRPNLRSLLVDEQFEMLSSSLVRDMVKEKNDISTLTSAGVVDFIEKEMLYKA